MKGLNLILLTGLLLVTSIACATDNDVTPSLVLNQLTVIKPTERGGDELYFDINIYRPCHNTQYLRVPKQPFHWGSKFVDEFKQIPLWSQPLKVGESTTLIISLIDSDKSDLNPDDLIGSMRVDIKNKEGKVQTHWSMPNRQEWPVSIKGDIQKFELRANQGQYDVFLSVANLPHHKF